jgi:hypothetical protein
VINIRDDRGAVTLLMNWSRAFGSRCGPLLRSPKLIHGAGILGGFAAHKN